MSSMISNHDYPGFAVLGDVFNISTAASFAAANATIVATSSQVGESAEYSPFHPSGTHNEQFAGSHSEQFEVTLKNIEKSLAAAQPKLSPTELWEGVFNITTFHVGPLTQKVQLAMAEVARRYLGKNKPGWTAIGVAFLLPPKALVEVQVQAAYRRE